MIAFRIEGRISSGKNAMQIDPRTGRHYPKKEFSDWRDQVLAQMRSQLGMFKLIVDPVELECVYSAPDRRVRDVAGMLDALCHVLEKYPVLANDGQIQNVIWSRCDVPKRAGLLVRITPRPAPEPVPSGRKPRTRDKRSSPPAARTSGDTGTGSPKP